MARRNTEQRSQPTYGTGDNPRGLATRASRMVVAALLATGAVSSLGSSRERLHPTTLGDVTVPLTIGVSGCNSVRTGAVCELPSGVRELKFWFPGAAKGEHPFVTSDGREVACGPEPKPDGMHVAASSGVVVVCRVHLDAAKMRLDFGLNGRFNSLHVSVASHWPWQDEVAALANRDAMARLNAIVTGTTGAERGRALSTLAVRQTAVGEWRAACDTLALAAITAEELGRYSESRHRWLVCAYQAAEHYDFELARTSIERATKNPHASEAVVDVEREAFVAYARSYYHTKLGQHVQAEAAYEQTIEWSRRGAAELGERSAVGLAHLAAERGRHADAVSLLTEAARGGLARTSPCFLATVLHNLGRQELNAHWSRLGSASWLTAAEAHLIQAAELVDGACKTASASEKAWISLELGFVAWHHGQRETARRLWMRAGPADADGYYWAWRTILDAELALEEGHDLAARREFERLLDFGETTARLPMQWRAAEGLGRVYAARGQWPLAVEQFRRAEQILTASEGEISVENGLLGFTSGKIRSAQGLASALLHQGRVREAFEVARVARRRALSAAEVATSEQDSPELQEARAVYVTIRERLTETVRRSSLAPLNEVSELEQNIAQQRAAQSAALTRLMTLHRGSQKETHRATFRAPEPGEALLLWFEGSDGWHGFAESDGHLVHVSAREPDGEWLRPLATLIRRTEEIRRVTILGFGKSTGRAVHVLPLEGRPLFQRFDVSYGLDLAPREVERPDSVRVLLAADARGDLPLAAAESLRLAQLYSASGASVVSLNGASLEAAAFRGAVDSIDVLHFAGHARLAGNEGWESWFELAHEARFTVADILSLPNVPRLVVLNACQAAANRELAQGPGLGLAHAWILAGSDAVVAPALPVPDGEAYRFAEVFTTAFVASNDAAQAYRAALDSGAASDAARASYRVIRP